MPAISSAKLIFADEQKRADEIQARMRSAAMAEYSKTGTGRFARGINARVINSGSPGEKIASMIRVTAINYRETRFLTDIGGGGYFKSYPVRPYRIFARGGLEGPRGKAGSKVDINFVRSTAGEHRLKVPRAGRFFEAFRKHGGGESRRISDALGPMDPGDAMKAFFFYPLWVNHPGFRRDIISQIAIQEGAAYQDAVVTIVEGEVRKTQMAGVSLSRNIPVINPNTTMVQFKAGTGGVVLDKGAQELFDRLGE